MATASKKTAAPAIKSKSAPAKGAPEKKSLLAGMKLPAGMKPLSSGTRPDGFLVTPTDETPTPCTFVGILRAMGLKGDPRRPGKPAQWGVFEAFGDQPETFMYTDRVTGEVTEITDGALVGVSKKGALHGMTEEKIGHLFAFAFTGEKIEMEKGKNAMWEIEAQISDEPFVRD